MTLCRFCRKSLDPDLVPGENAPVRELCPHCGMDVHVCVNCEFYDPSYANSCREPQAERVSDPEARNACEYFRLRGGDDFQDDEAAKARAQLENLFKK